MDRKRIREPRSRSSGLSLKETVDLAERIRRLKDDKGYSWSHVVTGKNRTIAAIDKDYDENLSNGKMKTHRSTMSDSTVKRKYHEAKARRQGVGY